MTLKPVYKRLVLYGLAIICVGWGLGIIIFPKWNAYRHRGDREECTIFIDQMWEQNQPQSRSGGREPIWYPQHPDGECAALGSIIKTESSAVFFAHYSTRVEQVQYFKTHGTISPALNPWRYIQGLKEDDPDYLVVMYLKKKTHWRSHESAYSDQMAWIVKSPQMTGHWGKQDNCWLNTTQLRERLERTYEFLRINDRPNWQLTLKEHGPFLEELKRMEANGQ